MKSSGKILGVDDNPTNLEILQELLEDYELAVAASGEEALEIAKSFKPDLILLDIMMPGIDGYEVCKRLCASSKTRAAKIIMVSAKSSVSERLEAYDAGADDYVVKPFDKEELLAKIKVFLKLKSIEEVDKLKTELLRLMCVDTANPISSILKPLDPLTTGEQLSPQQQIDIVDRVKLSAYNLEDLFDRVIAYCAMKAGSYQYNFKQDDLRETVEEASESVAAIASERNITIRCNLGRSRVCQIDKTEMQKVVAAILDNAIRYSPRNGEIIIDLSDDGVCYKLQIKNKGKGINPEGFSRIYEEFTYAEVTNYVAWRGLSLPIAKYIIHEHGGKISITSTPGDETTFTITLPIVKTL